MKTHLFVSKHTRMKATPQLHNLNLEASARSATTSSLELATLRAHVRLRLAAGSTGSAEVLHSVTARAATMQQHGVRASRGAESQLVERQALASGLHDARAGSLREAQSAHLHRGNLDQAHVVRNGAHHHGDLAVSALHVSRQRAQAHGRTVDSAHVETTKHHLGELRARATSNEAVQLRISELGDKKEYLHQKSQIDVIALGSLSGLVSALAASSNQINTLQSVRVDCNALQESNFQNQTHHVSFESLPQIWQKRAQTRTKRRASNHRDVGNPWVWVYAGSKYLIPIEVQLLFQGLVILIEI